VQPAFAAEENNNLFLDARLVREVAEDWSV